MAKNNDNKKIPGAVIAIVAVVVAVAVFVPTVYMPYKNKKPVMDSEHAEAVATLEYYDQSIQNQAAIEKDIEELEKEWEEFQDEMFVDAEQSLDDLQKSIDDVGIYLTSFVRGNETEDESHKVSFTGSPLYYVSIKISGYADQEKLLEFLNKVEEESVGRYYVKTLSANTVDEDKEVGKYTAKKGELNVNMDIYLYYYNQDIKVEITSDTDTETDTEA